MSTNSPRTDKYTWEVGPLQLLKVPIATPGHHAATSTALAYNCLIRALNSIYHQTPHVPPTHYPMFVKYSLAVYNALTSILESEKVLAEQIECHLSEKKVTPHLLPWPWGAYLHSIDEGKTTFTPSACMPLLMDFFKDLQTHFIKHVHNLTRLDAFTALQTKVAYNLEDTANAQNRKTFRALGWRGLKPVFLSNHDMTGEMELPDGLKPGIVAKLCRGTKTLNSWQFSTCGFDGQPRELKFLEKKEK